MVALNEIQYFTTWALFLNFVGWIARSDENEASDALGSWLEDFIMPILNISITLESFYKFGTKFYTETNLIG